MNAIELLKADHDRVEALFDKFKQDEDGSHGALAKQIRNELETHTHIEETIFYPAAMKRGKQDLKKIVREGLEEHAEVKDLLADLSTMTARNKQFNAKLKVVVENVEHHVEEEEGEMFPLAEEQFSKTQLEKLGAEMEAEKISFQKKNGIKPSPEAKPKGVAAAVGRAVAAVGEMFTGSTSTKSANAKVNGRSNGKSAKSDGKTTAGKTKPAKATSRKSGASKPAGKRSSASR
jgi:hemerythrin-like domain-containing protein